MNATALPEPVTLGCYVYGVVPIGTREPNDVEGIGDPPAPVTLVRHREIAAVVSEVDTGRPLGAPGDLLGHARVLDSLAAANVPVLPFRFGAVVRDVEAVADDLLAPQERQFADALEDLTDLAQFTVRGTYREDRVLRDILAERADIARLREQVAGLPEDAARYQQIQLGELISQELTARGQADTARLLDVLAPLAARAFHADATADQPLYASFLVPHDRWKGFEHATEDLAADWGAWMELRMLGPLAPYDFASQLVDADVDAEGDGSWD
ncbi:GvpL/GvpF family gas vesicle protein [Kitasatospora sp. RB6PN24]|uniref:GvpL/GvpF family gas vesicle protein n=1 Tax=Kitasatospora humi TaxID=2893891 RepID=UPI001E470BAE|nr:GvpL/GvpF family gas vesicle protein [Kitasatospora humi]MCC9307826.1 GvpL/GvpF family gas vesicle protein [Kitasatospora humi]